MQSRSIHNFNATSQPTSDETGKKKDVVREAPNDKEMDKDTHKNALHDSQ